MPMETTSGPYRVPDPLRTKILQAGAKDLKFVHYTHATEEKKTPGHSIPSLNRQPAFA